MHKARSTQDVPNESADADEFSFSFPGYIENPYAFYREFLDNRPFFYSHRDHCHVVSRFEDVKQVLQDYETFGSGSGVIPKRKDNPDDFGFNPIFMQSPPEQTRLRKLSADAFSIAHTSSIQDEIAAIATGLLDRIPSGSTFDLVESYATKLTVHSLIQLIKVPGREVPRVYELVMDIINGVDYSANADTSFMSKDTPSMRIMKFLAAHTDCIRKAPAPGFPDKLLCAQVKGDRLTANELYGMFFVTLIAGTEDMIRAFSNVLLALWEYPDQKRLVLQDMDELLTDGIFEALRLYPTTHYLRRVVERDCDLYATPLAKGDSVVAVIGAANRDERQFENPDRFEIDRYNVRSSLAFGAGPHVCLGKNIGRLILKVGIAEFLKKFPSYEIDPRSSRKINRAMIMGYKSMVISV